MISTSCLPRRTRLCIACSLFTILFVIIFGALEHTDRLWAQEPQTPTTDFGTQVAQSKLKNLLSSKKIDEIRRAVRMMKSAPDQCTDLFSIVARRVNHPELTEPFEWMVPLCSQKTLQEQLGQLTEPRYQNARKLIRVELGLRKTMTPQTIAFAPAAPNSTAPPATAPPATAASQNAARPQRPAPSNPTVATTISPHRQQTNLPKTIKRLETLEQINPAAALREEDWEFLFATLESDPPVTPSIHRRSQQLCRNHLVNNEARIRERLIAPNVRNRQNFARIFYHAPYKEKATDEALWTLAVSGDARVRQQAMGAINLTKENANDFADRLLAHLATAPSDKATQAGLAAMVSNLARVGSQSIRHRLFEHQLNQSEAAFRTRASQRQSNSGRPRVYSNAISILRAMPEQEQRGWVNEIANRASRSAQPNEYMTLFSIMECDISDGIPYFKRKLKASSSRYDALTVAKLLYRAAGPSSGVYPLFKDVVLEPSVSDRELTLALVGIAQVGPPAAELVPRIMSLIDMKQSNGSNYSFCLAALRAIGPEASAAGPMLVELLTKPDNCSTLDSWIVKTISEIKPAADAVLPKLVEISVDQQGRYSNGDSVRTDALQAIQTYGSKAASFAQTLAPLAESPNQSVARQARETLRIIQQ